MMIHQLQASFSVEHDRILVRMNTQSAEELRLWLTRRIVKKLLPHLVQATTRLVNAQAQLASHDGADANALAQFRKQETLQQADFKTPFDAQAATLPIGSEPLLATVVHITSGDNGVLRIGFVEKIPHVAESRSFEVTLELALLHGFLHLIETALHHADWDITPGGVEPLRQTDAFAAIEPPRYMN